MSNVSHNEIAAFALSLVPHAIDTLQVGFAELVESLRANEAFRTQTMNHGIDAAMKNDRSTLSTLRKPNHEFVTSAEKDAEAYMRQRVRDQYPMHAIVGEEHGNSPGEKLTWVFDPIDGTSAMIRTAITVAYELPLTSPPPGFGLTIGVLDGDVNIIGVIAELAVEHGKLSHVCTWTGINSADHTHAISVAAPRMSDAILTCTVPPVMFGTSKKRWGQFLALRNATSHLVEDRNCLGFIDLLRGDAHIAIEADMTLPDVASLLPILQSAGFQVTDLDGTPLRFDKKSRESEYQIFAALPALHAKALKIFREGVTDLENNFATAIDSDLGYVKKFNDGDSRP